MIIADEATGRKAPPMMGYRLHIPNVRPQVNSRHLKSLTYPHALSQWRHYLASPHLTHVIKVVTCYQTRLIARIHGCLLMPILLRFAFRNMEVQLLNIKNLTPTTQKKIAFRLQNICERCSKNRYVF